MPLQLALFGLSKFCCRSLPFAFCLLPYAFPAIKYCPPVCLCNSRAFGYLSSVAGVCLVPYALCPMPYACAACALSGISVLLQVSLSLSLSSLALSFLSFLSLSLSLSLSPLLSLSLSLTHSLTLSLSLALHTPFSFGSHFFSSSPALRFFLSSSRTYMSVFTTHFPPQFLVNSFFFSAPLLRQDICLFFVTTHFSTQFI